MVMLQQNTLGIQRGPYVSHTSSPLGPGAAMTLLKKLSIYLVITVQPTYLTNKISTAVTDGLRVEINCKREVMNNF